MVKKITHNSKLALKQYNFPIVMEHDKDGYFVFCPELQGCYTQGDTYENALDNIRDAIKLHIKDREAREEKINRRESVSIAMVEVAV